MIEPINLDQPPLGTTQQPFEACTSTIFFPKQLYLDGFIGLGNKTSFYKENGVWKPDLDDVETRSWSK